jgi:mRNA interferase RelE/StbE
MYRLAIKKSARKELDDLPDQIFLRVDESILSLRENPFPYPHAKKLKGENKCRLRVGDYRVVYSCRCRPKDHHYLSCKTSKGCL